MTVCRLAQGVLQLSYVLVPLKLERQCKLQWCERYGVT
jgi:hypothetical protein